MGGDSLPREVTVSDLIGPYSVGMLIHTHIIHHRLWLVPRFLASLTSRKMQSLPCDDAWAALRNAARRLERLSSAQGTDRRADGGEVVVVMAVAMVKLEFYGTLFCPLPILSQDWTPQRFINDPYIANFMHGMFAYVLNKQDVYLGGILRT